MAWAASAHASRVTRTVASTPGCTCWVTTPSPSLDRSASMTGLRTSSWASGPGTTGAASVVSVSADDNRLTPPPLAHVFGRDPLLQQDDALEQRLRARRTARDVHVDRHDLIDALRH